MSLHVATTARGTNGQSMLLHVVHDLRYASPFQEARPLIPILHFLPFFGTPFSGHFIIQAKMKVPNGKCAECREEHSAGTMRCLSSMFNRDICDRCAVNTVMCVVRDVLRLSTCDLDFVEHHLPSRVYPHHNLTGHHKGVLRAWLAKHHAQHDGDLLGAFTRAFEVNGVSSANQTTSFLVVVFDGILFNHIIESAHSKYVVSLLQGHHPFQSWQDRIDDELLIPGAVKRFKAVDWRMQQKPWTPADHHTFPHSFKRTVCVFLHCFARSNGLPDGMLFRIIYLWDVRRAVAERCLEAVPGELFAGSGPLFPVAHPDRFSAISAVLWEAE